MRQRAMWKRVGVVVCVVPFLLLGSPTATTLTVVASVPMAQSIWKRFSSTEGRFAVLFPGEPGELKRPVQYGTDQATEFRMFYVERPKEKIVYAVAYNDFPMAGNTITPELMQRALVSGRDSMLKSLQATLISERPIQLDTAPGREIIFKLPNNALGRIRIYFVGQRLYQVWSIVDADRQKYLTKSIEGFLNSFEVVSNAQLLQ